MLTLTSAQLDAWVAAFVWPFLRVLAFIGTAPLLHDRAVPARVKVGLAAAVAAAIAPSLPAAPASLSAPGALLLIAQQVLIGVALGWSLRIVFAAVELAGDLVGLQMGLAFAGFIDPASGHPSPMVGSFLALLATLIFLAIDGHLVMIAALGESFRAVPVGAEGAPLTDPARLVATGATLFRIGLELALPALVTMLLVNLALGVLARAAPQLNVFAVGFPATLLVGFAALAAALAAFGPAVTAALEAAVAAMLP